MDEKTKAQPSETGSPVLAKKKILSKKRGLKMSVRSYTRIWIHLIWGTKNHEKLLPDRDFRKKVSRHLALNSEKKNILMKINYINADHVHTLIDLPTNITVKDAARLLKGELSSWINSEVAYKFNWATGYAAFSVSESKVKAVVSYIKNQEDHHKRISYGEEYDEFLRGYHIKK